MPLWLACHSLYRSGWPQRSAYLCLLGAEITANHHFSWQDSASLQLPLLQVAGRMCTMCLQRPEEGARRLRATSMRKTEPRSSERATSPVIHGSAGPAFLSLEKRQLFGQVYHLVWSLKGPIKNVWMFKKAPLIEEGHRGKSQSCANLSNKTKYYWTIIQCLKPTPASPYWYK